MEAMIKKLKLEVQSLKGQLLELGVAPRAPDKSLKEPIAEAPPNNTQTTFASTPSTSNTTAVSTTQEESK